MDEFKCDECGISIPFSDFTQGATRVSVYPSSLLTEETYETLCKEHSTTSVPVVPEKKPVKYKKAYSVERAQENLKKLFKCKTCGGVFKELVNGRTCESCMQKKEEADVLYEQQLRKSMGLSPVSSRG